ncbi:MAG: arylesterase [Bacteroidetes bacterium]|nr:MAG: arylesterase [Bacteroidota bacterium]
MQKIHTTIPILITVIFFTAWLGCKNRAQSDTTTALDSTLVDEEEPGSNTGVKTILFFGNSLTAGYGLEISEAFPALIQKKIDSLGLKYNVINAGLSGETSADGRSRIDWLLDQKVDIFVLELGANDGLRGIPPDETRRNLRSIIEQVRAKNPQVKILLLGMEVPPNLGEDYAREFRTVFKDLADSLDTAFLPFLLEGVAGEPELNLPDGIHPTPEGHKIVAENIWKALQPLL